MRVLGIGLQFRNWRFARLWLGRSFIARRRLTLEDAPGWLRRDLNLPG